MLFEKLAQRSEGEFYRKCKETQSTRKHVPRLWLYLKEKIEEKKQDFPSQDSKRWAVPAKPHGGLWMGVGNARKEKYFVLWRTLASFSQIFFLPN